MYTVTSMVVDMIEFNPTHEVEEDCILEDFFPKSLPEHLQPFMEHRIKLVLKTDAIFRGGESQIVNTSCVVKGKMQSQRGNLSMYLVPYKNLPLSFESGGYMDKKFKGRVMVKLTNYSTKKVKLTSGTSIGYIAMQPFSME